MTDRATPASPEIEKLILGAIILDNSLLYRVSIMLGPEDFFHPLYRAIYKVMLELSNSGMPIDPVSIHEKLQYELPNNSIGISFISGLSIGLPHFTEAGILQHCRIVLDKKKRRTLIGQFQSSTNKLYDSNEISEIAGEAQIYLYQSVADVGDVQISMLDDCMNESTEETLARCNSTNLDSHILSTGFVDLDQILSGLEKQDLIIIAGRPSMGKTSLAMCIAINVALRSNKNVMFFSLEMSKKQMSDKAMCIESKVSSIRYKNAQLLPNEWDKIIEAKNKFIQSRKIKIDDSARITPGNIRNKIFIENQIFPIDLLVVDYLQLMDSDKSSDSRLQEVSQISRNLKAIAKEFDIPVIALSQLSRKPEERRGNRPVVSDLRESGTIEQDADKVLLIYREDFYREDKSQSDHRAEIIVAKNRNGPIGSAFLRFDGNCTRFDNLSMDY